MKKKYDHLSVEKKWQEKWDADEVYRADDNSDKPKEYVLDMFPYPSGAGLHTGHVESYTATDIYTRFKRMNGKEVLHPIGWDAFGLPAENYAIKTKIPPQKNTDEAINNFRKQMKSLGLSYDWSREIGTHTPEYYRWTQWFFLLLCKNGLAYRAKAKVNWCSSCQTVLANEQVVDGVCERCSTEVVQKDLEQWFFKTTQYAEELLSGLDNIDWPDSTKIAQRNWIGKSEGAEIDFELKVSGSDAIAGKVKVFTTRPDTLFGATYLVLAPEHVLIEKLLKLGVRNEKDVREYIKTTSNKTDIERSMEGKEKTGVPLSDIKAINPATKEEIPVYIADYVFNSYGTGAIMAVPAHDARDFEFAQKFDLPIRKVIKGDGEYYMGTGELIGSGEFTGKDSAETRQAIAESVGGKMVTTYRLRDWLVSRQRYWGAPIPIIYCDECGTVPVPEEDLPVKLPEDVDFVPTGESPLALSKSFHQVKCPTCGKPARRESDTMDTFVCSSWYYYRFTDPHNNNVFASEHTIKKWLPVNLYMGGAEHTVLHLLYARFFTKILHELGYTAFDEPFQKLRHQGMILAEDGRKMSKSLGNVVNPDDVVREYGADTLRIYEMFMGPIDIQKAWNTKNITGAYRFVERSYRLLEKRTDNEPESFAPILHETIKKVGSDISELKFNTAISQLMICLNAADSGISDDSLKVFTLLLAPFAPHLAEEMWENLGEKDSVHIAEWPVYDEAILSSGGAKITVQINGKRRGEISLADDASQEDALASARAIASVDTILSEGKQKRIIYIPKRILNIVV